MLCRCLWKRFRYCSCSVGHVYGRYTKLFVLWLTPCVVRFFLSQNHSRICAISVKRKVMSPRWKKSGNDRHCGFCFTPLKSIPPIQCNTVRFGIIGVRKLNIIADNEQGRCRRCQIRDCLNIGYSIIYLVAHISVHNTPSMDETTNWGPTEPLRISITETSPTFQGWCCDHTKRLFMHARLKE